MLGAVFEGLAHSFPDQVPYASTALSARAEPWRSGASVHWGAVSLKSHGILYHPIYFEKLSAVLCTSDVIWGVDVEEW